jgi:phosphatidylglycerophosphate synthase
MTPPQPGIHWANVVTSVRLVLALSLWVLGAAASWTIVAIAATGATLDLVDGRWPRPAGAPSGPGSTWKPTRS